jgi:N-acetylglucosamine PTS system EIICBA or EIICB component
VYGAANRGLIPLGMHHFINSFIWFQAGECRDAAGTVFHGDLTCFFNAEPRDPDVGIFMAGFFPIMMFALPAAALAMVHEARPAERKAVAGILLSAALTSLVTGVTEPLEFAVPVRGAAAVRDPHRAHRAVAGDHRGVWGPRRLRLLRRP